MTTRSPHGLRNRSAFRERMMLLQGSVTYLSVAWTSALLSSRSSAISTWLKAHARCRGVTPMPSFCEALRTSTDSSVLTCSKSPFLQASSMLLQRVPPVVPRCLTKIVPDDRTSIGRSRGRCSSPADGETGRTRGVRSASGWSRDRAGRGNR